MICTIIKLLYWDSFFFRIVNLLELAEDVSILRRDAAGLEHSNTEGEDATHLQLACQTITTAQLGVCDVTQLEIWRKPQGGRLALGLWFIETALAIMGCDLHTNSKLCTIARYKARYMEGTFCCSDIKQPLYTFLHKTRQTASVSFP